jgi:beta-mannosidase
MLFKKIINPIIKIFPVFIYLALTACGRINYMAIEKINLDENWIVKSEDDSISLKITIPNEIHSDLYSNGIIDNLFFGDNEKKLQWIAEKNWVYEKNFEIDSTILTKENIELVINGIDTYADVFLNDAKILHTDNQFRRWTVSAKKLLKNKNNHLKIILYSPFPIEKQKIQNYGFLPPGDERIFTRKAQYVYGWDWAPRYVTSGIWKDVNILAWDGPELKDICIKQKLLLKEKAQIVAKFEINSSSNEQVTISLNEIEQKVSLIPGDNVFELEYSIDNPKLWWPNGLGKQNLYNFVCSMNDLKKGKQSVIKKIGLRTIELVQEPDSAGKSFYFKVNGVPVFMKGANYIPLQMLGAKADTLKYRELINDVKESNMNMLRVWGGGIYENDIFYDLCDENGILVWQDFMFANGMYPADTLMLNNINIEAEQKIKQLRNHASIALWCGNNEISEGWANWGWKNNYSEQQQIKMSEDYNKIFHQRLPDLVNKYSEDISYWPSSPEFGRGNKRSQFEGDSHYWGVWHDAEPFEIFEKRVPRFMSEFGFQSYPSLKTLKENFNKTDLNFDSPILQTHQKHSRGNELIKTYLQRDYPESEEFYQFIYLSQLLQAEGISIGIEAHRRAMPYCMGSLYWQLNDCWPAISWSGIDYGGRWKALQYFAKKKFKSVLISPVEDNNTLKIFIVNDMVDSLKGRLFCNLIKFDGTTVDSIEKEVIVYPNSSRTYAEIDMGRYKNIIKDESFLNLKFSSGGQLVDERNYYFVKPKELKLVNPEIICKVEHDEENYKLILLSKSFAKNVFVDIKQDGKLSDNYFDLFPGKLKEIRFYPGTGKNIDLVIKIMSLWDVSNNANN